MLPLSPVLETMTKAMLYEPWYRHQTISLPTLGIWAGCVGHSYSDLEEDRTIGLLLLLSNHEIAAGKANFDEAGKTKNVES